MALNPLGLAWKGTAPSVSAQVQPQHQGLARPAKKGTAPSVSAQAQPQQHQRGGRVSQAAAEYVQGLKEGLDVEDVVAMQLGAKGVENQHQLTDTQKRYADAIKVKLAETAAADAAAEAERSRDFVRGKLAYERGQYPEAAVLLQTALKKEGMFTKLGGDIQLWLALAFEACREHEKAIDLYKFLETQHPAPRLRKQAANLRYILEAPKLRIREDERISLPVLKAESRKVERGASLRRAAPRLQVAAAAKPAKSPEYEYKLPAGLQRAVRNKYVVAASTCVAIGLAWYSTSLAR